MRAERAAASRAAKFTQADITRAVKAALKVMPAVPGGPHG